MAEVQKYVTPVFRGSFVNVFSPQSVDGGEPKYGLSAIWTPKKFGTKDKSRWNAMMNALNSEAKRAFKKGLKELPDNYKKGVRDGAEKEDVEGYGAGTKFASLTSKMRPGVVDLNGNDISPEEGNADEVYSGAYFQATVTVYSYNNKNKGVSLGLYNLRKIKDGPRLDLRGNAAEDFADDAELDDSWLEEDEDVDGDGDDDEGDGWD
ncbi:MAG: ssDNA-binding protein [Cyanobacteria bacterium J06638_20]